MTAPWHPFLNIPNHQTSFLVCQHSSNWDKESTWSSYFEKSSSSDDCAHLSITSFLHSSLVPSSNLFWQWSPFFIPCVCYTLDGKRCTRFAGNPTYLRSGDAVIMSSGRAGPVSLGLLRLEWSWSFFIHSILKQLVAKLLSWPFS